MKRFLSIPVIGIYCYIVTVLFQYGYNSYFGIPTAFIESSIKDNVLYLFFMYNIITSVVGSFDWLLWVLFVFTLLLIVGPIFFWKHYPKVLLLVSAIIIVFVTLYISKFGAYVARLSETFAVPSPECNLKPHDSYIVPVFYQGKAIIVPYDQATNKMKGAFIISSLSDTNCRLEYKNIGKLER